MAPDIEAGSIPQKGGWRLFGRSSTKEQDNAEIPGRGRLPKWNMGILNDRETIEVPGKSTQVHCSAFTLVLTFSQARSYYWPRTITSPLACGTHLRELPTHQSQPPLFGLQNPHRTKRRKRVTAKSFSNLNQKNLPMTPSTGQHGAEIPPCSPWASFAWWAAA